MKRRFTHAIPGTWDKSTTTEDPVQFVEICGGSTLLVLKSGARETSDHIDLAFAERAVRDGQWVEVNKSKRFCCHRVLLSGTGAMGDGYDCAYCDYKAYHRPIRWWFFRLLGLAKELP